jgi:hypothetical protein
VPAAPPPKKKQNPGTPAVAPPLVPARRKAKPGEPVHEWVKGTFGATATPSPAVALFVSGPRSLMLLAAEHGVHRLSSGGSTSLLRVRFEPKALPIGQLPELADLETSQPVEEIRRVFTDKRQVHDTRTGWKGSLGDDGALDLEPALDAYLRWRIFSADSDDEGDA